MQQQRRTWRRQRFAAAENTARATTNAAAAVNTAVTVINVAAAANATTMKMAMAAISGGTGEEAGGGDCDDNGKCGNDKCSE